LCDLPSEPPRERALEDARPIQFADRIQRAEATFFWVTSGKTTAIETIRFRYSQNSLDSNLASTVKAAK
jgi:hypothetical protein